MVCEILPATSSWCTLDNANAGGNNIHHIQYSLFQIFLGVLQRAQIIFKKYSFDFWDPQVWKYLSYETFGRKIFCLIRIWSKKYRLPIFRPNFLGPKKALIQKSDSSHLFISRSPTTFVRNIFYQLVTFSRY